MPTLTGRVLFVLVVLSHCRRRIVHFNVTDHPTATWAAQQIVDAFPDGTAPRWLHRDRDTIYSERFRQRVAGMGIAEVVSAMEPLAESVRGTRDRLNPPRVCGSCDRAECVTSATHPHDVRALLSSKPDSPGAGEGHARSSFLYTRSSGRIGVHRAAS